jgi:hypothetical protein
MIAFSSAKSGKATQSIAVYFASTSLVMWPRRLFYAPGRIFLSLVDYSAVDDKETGAQVVVSLL